MRKHRLTNRTRAGGWGAILIVLVAAPNCTISRTTRIHPSQLPQPAREASLGDLVAQVNAQNAAIRTFTATVELQPTAGSVYSGIIKEYRDVRGFVLVEKPAMIRMIGQAPIVRTNIFDMVSDGSEFRVYIPPKQKFIVGKTDFQRPVKNALEHMRPQHILDALLIPVIDPNRESQVLEEAEEGGRRYYVVLILESAADGALNLKRKIWFDRATLEVARLQLYGPAGIYIQDVWYFDYRDFSGVRYPTRIELSRPVEDYRLAIAVQKATFNQPIAREKFELVKPAGAELVELGSTPKAEGPGGQ